MMNNNLAEQSRGVYVQRSSNLQMLRFVAAIMVIFSHSFSITQGNGANEWLTLLTNGQITFGGVAVAIFFLCGGYLACRSMEKQIGFIRYILLRGGRIVIPLMFVVVCCILVGGFISDLSLKAYFTEPMIYRYLLNGIMILQHNLPGVFGDACYKSTVNGSLWTLPVEFLCHIACYVLWKLGFTKKDRFKWTIPVVLIGCAGIYIIGMRIPLLQSIIRPGLLFYVGMMYWIYRDEIIYDVRIVIVALILLPICSVFGILNLGMIIFFPYAMMTFCFGSKQYFEKISQQGKYSYAMYLWGWPVQQFVAECFGWEMSPYMNTLISVIIVYMLSVMTYHLVEQRIGNLWSQKVNELYK